LRVDSAREDISHPPRCPQQKIGAMVPQRDHRTTVRRRGMWCYARRVGTPNEAQQERARAGLCADCTHARRIASDRGAKFYLCELAAVDPAYRKYPALPMLRCAGYQSKA
jgi:hypothetical protein